MNRNFLRYVLREADPQPPKPPSVEVDASPEFKTQQKVAQSTTGQRAQKLQRATAVNDRYIRRYGDKMSPTQLHDAKKRGVKLRQTTGRAEGKMGENAARIQQQAMSQRQQRPKTVSPDLPHNAELKPTAAAATEMAQKNKAGTQRFSQRVKTGETQSSKLAAMTTPGTQPPGAPSASPLLDKISATLKNSPMLKTAVGGLALGGALYMGHKMMQGVSDNSRHRIATMNESTSSTFNNLFG